MPRRTRFRQPGSLGRLNTNLAGGRPLATSPHSRTRLPLGLNDHRVLLAGPPVTVKKLKKYKEQADKIKDYYERAQKLIDPETRVRKRYLTSCTTPQSK